MKLSVKNLSNEDVGEIELSDDVFGVAVRRDILARMVNYQLAKRRAGTHKAKGISDIQGTTKKPFFGPVVRSHAFDLQKKVRRLALKTALSSKQAEGKLIVLDAATLSEGKTKVLGERLAKFGWDSVLIIDGPTLDENFARAASNLPKVDVLPQQGANVYDILRRDVLVLTRDAVQHLEARLK
jgi:large subunit ribosomal protein L4